MPNTWQISGECYSCLYLECVVDIIGHGRANVGVTRSSKSAGRRGNNSQRQLRCMKGSRGSFMPIWTYVHILTLRLHRSVLVPRTAPILASGFCLMQKQIFHSAALSLKNVLGITPTEHTSQLSLCWSNDCQVGSIAWSAILAEHDSSSNRARRTPLIFGTVSLVIRDFHCPARHPNSCTGAVGEDL